MGVVDTGKSFSFCMHIFVYLVECALYVPIALLFSPKLEKNHQCLKSASLTHKSGDEGNNRDLTAQNNTIHKVRTAFSGV